MYKFQNHIEILEAIIEARAKLPAVKDSYIGQTEAMGALLSIYACLDVNELKSIVEDFKKMNKRAAPRIQVPIKVGSKKIA